MGVVKPPLVSKKWFKQCTFNYCDHFGNKAELAKICKICRDELIRLELYKKEGKDPYNWKNVFKDIGESLAQTMSLIAKQAEEMGIDLSDLSEQEEEENNKPDFYKHRLYKLVETYGNLIEKSMNHLTVVPIDADENLVTKTLGAMSHSRHYILAKTYRALSSKWEESKDPLDIIDDSKTSAFLAYLAIERNSRAFLALAAHKPLQGRKEKHLKLAKLSLEIAKAPQDYFFPDESLNYTEFGCEDYDETFSKYSSVISISCTFSFFSPSGNWTNTRLAFNLFNCFIISCISSPHRFQYHGQHYNQHNYHNKQYKSFNSLFTKQHSEYKSG